MRKDLVPPREVWLGILVLGITVGLCVGLVVHARMQGFAPLFEIDQALLQRSGSGEVLKAFELPQMQLANWSPPRGTRVFAPDTLYEKIDGRADFYLQYNFQKLTFATYLRDDDPELNIEVWAYDMGNAENARGAFQAEAPDHPDSIEIGQGGYQSDGSVFFWKGPLYVMVMTINPELSDACDTLAKQIAESIVAEAGADWFKIALPDEGLVADSRGFESSDAFSLGFLNNVHTAQYEVTVGDTPRKLLHFIHQADNPEAAEALFKQYTAFFGDYGEVLSEKDGLVVGDGGGVIDAIFVVGRYFAGISDAPNAEVAEATATAFRQRLQTQREQLP